MIRNGLAGIREHWGLLLPSARLLVGRRFWIAPLVPLVWPAFLAFQLLVGWREEAYSPTSAQNTLIGLPLTVLAILLGVRVISGEIDRRTLEIAYTVPGGAHRVWIAKLTAAVGILLLAEGLLAVVALVFFTEYPAGALYGSLQGAVFYLVVAMALAAQFRSEASGALVGTAILVINGVITGFGENQLRVSPFWNPAQLEQRGTDAADLLAWTLQNRIGFVLAIAAVVAMGFARAERREKMLGG